MHWVADFFYLLAGLAYLPVAVYQAVVQGKNRRGWRQRFGGVPRLDPAQRRLWIHAVSLGEINATPKLVERLRERLGDCDLVFSTTTDTGYARAVQFYGSERVFRFPLDFSPVVSRTLSRLKPTMIVLVELEVWYNLVTMATRRGIPVVVVNGRLTQHSARRFQWIDRVSRSMFSKLTWVGAQDETIAARFRKLGVSAERVEVTSSLKWDSAAVTDRVDGAEALARVMGIDPSQPLWVCGSTGPGEEAIILQTYHDLLDALAQPRCHVEIESSSGLAPMARIRRSAADGSPVHATTAAPRPHDSPAMEGVPGVAILAIVPRKPERFEEVARLIEQEGYACIRRSAHSDGAAPPDSPTSAAVPTVLLGDTMGELRKFYALADVVFVGRSLVTMGGSDPMEVAALGKPIVTGRFTDNFALPIAALKKANAVRIVTDCATLAQAVRDILADRHLAKNLGDRAREVVLQNQGATDRTADQLIRTINAASGPAPGNTGKPAIR